MKGVSPRWLWPVMGLLLAGCGGSAQPSASSGAASPAGSAGSASAAASVVAGGPIKFSYPQPTAGFMPLWLAQDRGVFKKDGIETEMLNLPAPTDLQALLSG